VLHLATHGKIDLDRPARSALILARDRLPSPDEQAERARKGLRLYTGELRVGTILREWKGRLDCDLVVLSACETALGRKTSGQGLLGFAHALQVAGARSVVLSRWKVDDTATALLMLRLYENLLGARKGTKAQPRAAALQEAKSWLRVLGRKQARGLAGALVNGKLSGTRASEVELELKDEAVKLPAGERPFAHPAFWAAFTLLGDPD
jgi:CHAT domain-containing protein